MLLKERPVRATLSDIEIRRIAEYFYAHELSADEELREDTRGSDPLFVSVHRQLTEAGLQPKSPFDLSSLTLEAGHGLSPRMMRKINDDASDVLAVAQGKLATGDVSFIRYELNALLDVFQINLDPTSPAYRKLARAVMEAEVKALNAILARQRGEPFETPPLVSPSEQGAVAGGTLQEAFDGWKKERSPSRGVLAEYERAIRLFAELHGDLPVAQIKRTHARTFREALQDLPRHRSCWLRHTPLPELAEWGREHPGAPELGTPTVNKLLGGVQTVCLWAYDKGIISDEVHWADPFAKMRLPEDAPERDAFTVAELNTLFASPVFTEAERPKPGRGEAAFWLPLLSLYTGARQAELAALSVKDVTKVGGVVAFVFVEEKAAGKSLKTRSSARTVPVHPQLVKLGWLGYVDVVRRCDGESAWLFPQVAPDVSGGVQAWSKWFNRHLRSIGITDRRKVFHSFRHGFIDAMRSASVTDEISKALVGHSSNSVHQRYGAKEMVRRFGMDALKRAVNLVHYRGLNLSKVRCGHQRKRVMKS